MNKKLIESKLLGDSYWRIEHPSGLTVFVYPKEKMRSTYAVFGTKYGSIDKCFKRSDEETADETPAGIAHFLEHKLFESEEGDAFARFAQLGASANAYTSFETTRYLFSCTENAKQALEVLLDFVQSPYFTKQTVEKEQGIIGQEIKMYDDDPQWRVLFNLLRALFHNHPIKDDIAGTVESIAEITPEHLYRCYDTFYNLNNMALCVAGNCDVDEVMELCDKMLKPSKSVQVSRVFEAEPETIVQPLVEEKLSVALPIFEFGIKETINRAYRTEKDLAVTEVLLDIMASDGSDMFRRLLDASLINEASFSYEYFEGTGYGVVLFGGESGDPNAVCEVIREEMRRLKREGVTEEQVRRSTKSLYGGNLSGLNSADVISNAVM
ncbi:MAG: insulinase family protein, partial [Clostridia bacterium]|nr:insulinase family protein [Clostridia bacterium]